MSPLWFLIALMLMHAGAVITLLLKGEYADAWIFFCYSLSYPGFMWKLLK